MSQFHDPKDRRVLQKLQTGILVDRELLERAAQTLDSAGTRSIGAQVDSSLDDVLISSTTPAIVGGQLLGMMTFLDRVDSDSSNHRDHIGQLRLSVHDFGNNKRAIYFLSLEPAQVTGILFAKGDEEMKPLALANCDIAKVANQVGTLLSDVLAQSNLPRAEDDSGFGDFARGLVTEVNNLPDTDDIIKPFKGFDIK